MSGIHIKVENKKDEKLCPIRDVLSVVYKKWQMLILIRLGEGGASFAEVKRDIGDVSNRILSENLKLLERDGYVKRAVLSAPTKNVRYELSALGAEMLDLMMPLYEWAAYQKPTIDKNRDQFAENRQRRWF